MSSCLICSSNRVKSVLDLGMQPVSSHFVSAAKDGCTLHPLSLSVCRTCGILQLARPIPFMQLRPPYDWISYREPEAHLDALVNEIVSLDGVDKRGMIAGLSSKDTTILDRFRSHGFTNIRVLNPQQDLNSDRSHVGVETIQALFTTEKAASFSNQNGPASLVVARHILEHAERPMHFLEALLQSLAPGGLLVIEVPDCHGNLARCDYTMIWEEHSLYFTSETLKQTLSGFGCEVLRCNIYRFPFEDVVVLCARKSAIRPQEMRVPDPEVTKHTLTLVESYGRVFSAWTERYHCLFRRLTADGKRLAAYGAGHLTAAFLHFHDVAGFFACVVDDTPQKQGLYLPKSGLPITGPERLIEGDIDDCFLGLDPQLEDRIIARSAAFAARGGRFHSLLADSSRSLRRLIE